MRKNIISKKISKYALFAILAVFFSQIIFTQTSAAPVIDWENPTKTGKIEPYKFKTSDVLNSDLMMQVVGCTDIVNKVSLAITKFSSGVFDTFTKALTKEGREEIKEKVCGILSGVAQMTAGPTDGASGGGNITNALKDFIKCDETQKTKATTSEKAADKDSKDKEEAQRKMEQCFNGIAYTLAKNQLTSMARYAITWVNTGFGGDPFFVTNTQDLLNSIESRVLNEAINKLDSALADRGPYPYSRAFSRSLVSNNRLKNKGMGALLDLKSTMVNFITDPESYANLSELEKANRAIDLFHKDFHSGGWDAWMAFTQNEANNPIGYQMLAGDIIEQEKEEKTTETKEELQKNNGFLDQKICKQYDYNREDEVNEEIMNMELAPDYTDVSPAKTAESTPKPKVCIKWETVTPGSLIKDKISYYLNSPERQLEMADTINETLNAVFTILLSKLADQGLSSLTAEKYVYSDSEMMDTGGERNLSLIGGSNSYQDGNFNLVRDLGNRYNYNYTNKSKLGTWNVSTNTAKRPDGSTEKLVKNIGPIVIDANKDILYPINVYYEVTVPGKISLSDSGYSGWEVGDRAFWDGQTWQNWKCGPLNKEGECTNKKHPIAKRGVIQIQQDYKIAAKELLQNLPSVMPKLGELDYCIPGPNLAWDINYSEAIRAFSDYAYSLSTDYKTGSFFTRDSTTFKIAQEGEDFYDNYYNIFKGTLSFWEKVKQTQTWINLNELGGKGEVKKDVIEENLKELVNKELDLVNKNISTFRERYAEIIEGKYGQDGLMQKQFFYREDREEPIKNTAYLEIATVATPITKEIVQYNEDISNMTQEIKEAMVTTDSNIYKLQKIKDEVSKIIVTAQARRDKNMLKILNEEAERTGNSVLTEAQYKQKYERCLENENITFYDDLEIMKDSSTEAERCNDGLDNDWDGLVDSGDPDCTGSSTTGSGERVTGGDDSGIDWAFGSDGNNNQRGGAFGR